MRYFLSRKEQKSVLFVKEEFLKKKMFSDIFDHKLSDTEENSTKEYGLWRLVKGIRWLKSLIMLIHNVLREL